jgi:hypothetical protein
VSRGCKRTRVALKVTALVEGEPRPLLVATRDISATGLFVETPAPLPRGTRVTLSLLDELSGEALSLEGEVQRVVPGGADTLGGVGIRILEPPDPWLALVARSQEQELHARQRRPPRRLRVLVVGDEKRRRGALALYVTSGWDVRFASDPNAGLEAIRHLRLDAVVAEQDLGDDRWLPVLELALEVQPRARRVVRASLYGNPLPSSSLLTGLVDRIVDQAAGLDAVVEALTGED